MKAILFLCLLVFMTCEKDIIDIGKCIYKAPKVQEIISETMIAIVTKDYTKLLDKIKESLPDLIQIIIGCISEKTSIEDSPKAEVIAPQTPAYNCKFMCILQYPYNGSGEDKREKCNKECDKKYPPEPSSSLSKFWYN